MVITITILVGATGRFQTITTLVGTTRTIRTTTIHVGAIMVLEAFSKGNGGTSTY